MYRYASHDDKKLIERFVFDASRNYLKVTPGLMGYVHLVASQDIRVFCCIFSALLKYVVLRMRGSSIHAVICVINEGVESVL